MNGMSLKLNWVSLLLLLSLGINFFIGGYIYSQYKSQQIKMTRLSFDNSISRIVAPFPRKAKREFYVTMRSKRDQLIPVYENIMSQRTMIMNIIAAENLESEKMRNALEEYHNSYHSMIAEAQEVMIKVIGNLSPEEKQAILTRYKNPPENKYRRSNDRRRPPTDKEHSSAANNDW